MKKISDKKDVLKAIVIALVVLLVIDLTPLSGNVIMYAKWVQCGNKPLQDETWLVTGEVSHYKETSVFGFLRGSPEYFCSPREAELKGYSAESDGYKFPNLTKDEARSVLDRK